ncbi:MAG: thymidine phosphorylase [Veillonellaceae bacterium]|nr:thymidine phosphorylase [Veillonellaceae bacterium]
MRMPDLIDRKKRGGVHAAAELDYIIQEYMAGNIPDYQISAWLMAIWFQGLNPAETVQLTLAMAHSGQILDLSGIEGVKVDKHSTGGVADTTTLIVAPLVAAAGVKVAKMAGRGLGFTGGTIDKLESIPGFRTGLSTTEFVEQVRRVGLAIVGQTADLAPADGKIYALRDVTATVDSLPLIAASVMSKKLAAGADKILLDVKFGSGAFMKSLDHAKELARLMVDIGGSAGRQTAAVVTNMSEPLGTAIGNSLEVLEALEVLSGSGDRRLRDFCLFLAVRLLVLANPALGMAAATTALSDKLQSGAALAKFQEFITAQGGDGRVATEPDRLGRAACSQEICADRAGYVIRLDAARLGQAAILLGAGRVRKSDAIDLQAGIRLRRRCGEYVRNGDLLATLFYRSGIDPAPARRAVESAIELGEQPPATVPLIAGIMDEAGWREVQ